MPGIEIKNIKKSFGPTVVLEDINLKIDDGEFAVLIGESGCGKSTLLRMIAGLESITEGELLVNGVLFNRLAPEKRDISMVFQSYALYPHMNIYNNIAYGMKVRKTPKDEIERKVSEAAKILDIAHLLKRYPKNISGGQRQRVAMGRAIVRNPAVFLFDEPLSNLDAKLRISMRKEIKQIQKRLQTTTIYVTHDQIEAMTMADKVVLMNQGQIVQTGTPKELFDKPNSIFAATFLGSPSISLFNGIANKTGEGFEFFTKDKIKLPIPQFKNLQEGQEIILGIRPQDFFLCSENDDGFPIKIEFSEYTGSEYIAYGLLGQNDISVVFARKENIDENRALFVKYDLEKVHLFYKASGKAIFT